VLLVDRKKRLLLDIAKMYGVRLRFRKMPIPANALGTKSLINMSTSVLRKRTAYLISTLLHEIGHIHCYHNGIFKTYHDPAFGTSNDRRRTAWRAEQYVDRWAAAEMKQLYPHLTFTYAYVTDEDRAWLRNYWCNR
jgi:hypothetical protein